MFAWGYRLGRGVQGTASGIAGIGVHGFASNEGNVTNTGGYFVANGITGRGVQGYGKGTYGTGVYGNGKQFDFYADGTGANYGPFTGAHEVKFAAGMPLNIVQGMVVSVTGRTEKRKDKNGEISLSSTLPSVTLSPQANDKFVFGVIVSEGPLPKEHWYIAKEGERFGVVNALGEGRVWVTDINGGIEAGDYITTSSVPGYGQMQEDDIMHSYTLGKAIETIDWDQVTGTVQYDGENVQTLSHCCGLHQWIIKQLSVLKINDHGPCTAWGFSSDIYVLLVVSALFREIVSAKTL